MQVQAPSRGFRCTSAMECRRSDIGGAAAALWLIPAAAAIPWDPLTALQHYIRKHYPNTQQSEIEFRAPSPPPPLSLPAQRDRAGIPFSPYCWREPSKILCSSSTLKLNQSQFDLLCWRPDSATDVQYVHARNIWHVCASACPYVPPCQLTLLTVKWETASPYLLQNRPISV